LELALKSRFLYLIFLVLLGATLFSNNLVSVQSSTATLVASGDTYLKSGSPNQNEGASTFVRVQPCGSNRIFVQFNQAEIQSVINGGTLVSAVLQMTIIDNGDNWGTGRTVDVHIVLVDWTEGDSISGEGATWKCPRDSNIASSQPDGSEWKDLGPPYQNGGS